MKKIIVFIACAGLIVGVYIFSRKGEILPHDFGSVLVSWQRDRADNINDIIGLWRDTPLGKGERKIDIKAQYGDIKITGNLQGATISDVAKTLSLWTPELYLDITPTIPTIPIPGELQIQGPIVMGNTEAFFYATLGKLIVTVPSKTDVQNQFQQILDIGTNKTFQLGENLPSWYSIQDLSLFTEELRRKPLFLMAKDTGERDGFYTYTMTIGSEPARVLSDLGNLLEHCDLAVKKTDSSNFIIDCHSDVARLVWSSDKDKIVPNDNYPKAYEIYHKYTSDRKTWYVTMKEKGKIVKNVEFFWTRKDKRVSWEIIGDDNNRRLHFVLSGEEKRESDPTASVTIPTSIASWKEIMQQIVR